MSARLPISQPSDVGAASLAETNKYEADQIVDGVVIYGDYATSGPQTPGGRLAAMGNDAFSYYFEVGDWVDYSPDRINIGTKSPFRVQIGETNSASMDTAATPFFQSACPSYFEATSDCWEWVYDRAHSGYVWQIRSDDHVDRLLIEADGTTTIGGSLKVDGNLAPSTNNARNVGDSLHAYRSAVLHNGSSEYRLTVNSSGQVVATKIAANYLTGPSFELVSGAAPSIGQAGIPDGWRKEDTVTTVPVRTFVAGRTKGLALRTQFTGAPADNGFNVGILSDFVDEVLPGDQFTLSGYVKGALSGCVLYYIVYFYDSNSAYLGNSVSGSLSVTGSWTQRAWTATAAPANTARVRAMPYYYIANGTATIDASFDDFLLEKAAAPSAYFDGSYGSDCVWSGTANASTSRKG